MIKWTHYRAHLDYTIVGLNVGSILGKCPIYPQLGECSVLFLESLTITMQPQENLLGLHVNSTEGFLLNNLFCLECILSHSVLFGVMIVTFSCFLLYVDDTGMYLAAWTRECPA